jgi:hypothetical protein
MYEKNIKNLVFLNQALKFDPSASTEYQIDGELTNEFRKEDMPEFIDFGKSKNDKTYK